MPSAAAVMDFFKVFPMQLWNWVKSFTKTPTVVYSDPVFRISTRYLPAVAVLIACLGFAVNYFRVTDITCSSSRNTRIDMVSSGSRPYEVDLNTFCWNHGTFLVKKALHPEMRHRVTDPGISAYDKGKDVLINQGYYSSLWLGLAIAGSFAFLVNIIWKLKGEKKMKHMIDIEKMLAAATMNACECRAALLSESFGFNRSFGRNYICVKLLSTLVPIVALGFLTGFIGADFATYGIDVANFWAAGSEAWPSPFDSLFPLKAKCERNRVGFSGDIEVEAAVCQLPMNNDSRHSFLVLWWTLVTVFAVNTVHLSLMLRYCFTCYRRHVIRSYLVDVCRETVEEARNYVSSTGNKKKHRISDLIYVNIGFGDWFILYLLKQNLSDPDFRNMMWQVATTSTNRGFAAGFRVLKAEEMSAMHVERKSSATARSTSIEMVELIHGSHTPIENSNTLHRIEQERVGLQQPVGEGQIENYGHVSVSAMVAAIEDRRA